MDTLQYHIDFDLAEPFDGPLDLLLTLIQKNKVEITNIPIALICDQYMAYLEAAQEMDLDLTAEFIVMASELMLIKSKMLLPKTEEEQEDPRAGLAEALLKYQQAKEAAAKMALLYPKFSGRMVKDTDEISVDKTYVADQSVTSLCAAVRRIIAYREEKPRAEKVTFSPMISSPIVPVEAKIVGILKHFEVTEEMSLDKLLDDSVSLADMIAIFLGVLELVKVRRLRIVEDADRAGSLLGLDTSFVLGEDSGEAIESDFDQSIDTSLFTNEKETTKA
ncbi:MAG: segregation/condensation protein A [Clostridia bacterium]|nr:segregation/condensation protein A [Clostridia bacterium]